QLHRSFVFYFEVIKNNLHPQSFTYIVCDGLKFYFFTRLSNHILLHAPLCLASQFSYFSKEIKYILPLRDKDTLSGICNLYPK
ncbi:hypothetical protein CR513_60464, partial [Mucuna pruriens]